MRRGAAVASAVAVVVAAASGGWAAGRRIRSPEQAALESQPPPASLITVEVESTELTADVIIRADVGYDEPEALSLSGALGGDRSSALVVTSAPERGAHLPEGSPAIEISGRPVFLLAGPVPVFRDLRPRDRGPDVLQIEEALARLGHFRDEPDRMWDHATSAAVEAWYEAAGYEANGPNEAERSALRGARDQLDRARGDLKAAEEALAEAGEGPTELDVRRARTEVAEAEFALEKAVGDVETAVAAARWARLDAERAAAAAERGVVDARRGVVDARRGVVDAERGVVDAERGVVDADRSRERAARRYDQARVRWRSARTGVHPDTGGVPSAAQHEVLRTAVETASDGLAIAEKAVEDAEQAVRAAKLGVQDAERGVVDAERALVEAESDAYRRRSEVPTREEEARARTRALLGERSAEDRLSAARQTLADLLAPPDTDELSERAVSLRGDVDDAVERLAELEAATGVWLPAGELIFLDRLPVRVDLLAAERGTAVSGAFMTVTGSELAVRGSVSERDVDSVHEGGEARIEDRGLESPITGTVRLVERRAGTRGAASDRHYLEMVADGIPDDLVGRNVKVVIPVGDTDGAVLVVPIAALSATASGVSRVEVEQPDGSTLFVEVEPGLSTGGQVEVTPVDGELRAGDRVVVGVASGE